ncbi:hypothetical protein [uncultured Kordia sp.]|uniref:hypothetical protein n=1 Tax=uncultured Kordia sp. TaxID=507699 RepID=UPI002625D1CC|nr:hypothetical protein [uncultured Kordia sp.]
MEILIFQTDIASEEEVMHLKTVFNNHSDIINWSVDFEDIDNVLRIEANSNLTENTVIKLVKKQKFNIKTMLD